MVERGGGSSGDVCQETSSGSGVEVCFFVGSDQAVSGSVAGNMSGNPCGAGPLCPRQRCASQYEIAGLSSAVERDLALSAVVFDSVVFNSSDTSASTMADADFFRLHTLLTFGELWAEPSSAQFVLTGEPARWPWDAQQAGLGEATALAAWSAARKSARISTRCKAAQRNRSSGDKQQQRAQQASAVRHPQEPPAHGNAALLTICLTAG